MRKILFNFYEKSSRKKSYRIFLNGEKRKKRQLEIKDWWEKQKNSSSIIYCPLRPGDEIFDVGFGNIFLHVAHAKRLDVIEHMINKGLSPCLSALGPSENINCSEENFISCVSDATSSQRPSPVEQAIINLEAEVFSKYLKDKDLHPLFWEQNPHMDLGTNIIFLGAVECLEELIINDCGIEKNEKGSLCFVRQNWRDVGSCSILDVVLHRAPPDSVRGFLDLLGKNYDIKKEIKDLEFERWKVAVLKGNLIAVEELLKRGWDVNNWNDIVLSPLYVASYSTHQDMVNILLRYGASWETHHGSIGERLIAEEKSLYREKDYIFLTTINAYKKYLSNLKIREDLSYLLSVKKDGNARKM